jgi:addiction module HigA family antidote
VSTRKKKKVAARKLDMLNAARDVQDLKAPPGNGLEMLNGDRKRRYSIRLNDQYRIVFQWSDGNAKDVGIVDYHEEINTMIPKQRQPTHPGEILLEEFLRPMKLSQVELARRMGVPVQRVNTLINGKRDMTAGTAILLSRELKTTSEFWMNLQVAVEYLVR